METPHPLSKAALHILGTEWPRWISVERLLSRARACLAEAGGRTPDGDDERRLTPSRLESIRRYLVERGVDPKRIYVESRIDARLGEPVLLVELVGRPGRD